MSAVLTVARVAPFHSSFTTTILVRALNLDVLTDAWHLSSSHRGTIPSRLCPVFVQYIRFRYHSGSPSSSGTWPPRSWPARRSQHLLSAVQQTSTATQQPINASEKLSPDK